MLKIKDTVDLKELEKFGFKTGKTHEYYEDVYYDDLFKYTEDGIQTDNGIFIEKDTRKLLFATYIVSDNSIDNNLMISNTFIDKIYDLIKADILEKVEE